MTPTEPAATILEALRNAGRSDRNGLSLDLPRRPHRLINRAMPDVLTPT